MQWQEHQTGPPADWPAGLEGGYTDDDGVRWYHDPHTGWKRARVFLDAGARPPWWRRLAGAWRWGRRLRAPRGVPGAPGEVVTSRGAGRPKRPYARH